jgi:hypothetical protein
MTAPIPELSEAHQKLRELEEAIAAQRRLIAAEGSGCDKQAEHIHMAKLLHDLDQMLAECELAQREASLDRVLVDCPL